MANDMTLGRTAEQIFRSGETVSTLWSAAYHHRLRRQEMSKTEADAERWSAEMRVIDDELRTAIGINPPSSVSARLDRI